MSARAAVRETVFPVRYLLVSRCTVAPLALPVGKVAILDRKIGQWRRMATPESVVCDCELLREDAQRPSIHNHMM